MAIVLADRVKESTTTTGTGTVTLAGAASGYQSFSVVGNGNSTYYTISGGSEWEVGIGTYTSSGTTLSRDTVLASSNSGSLVNFAAGTKDVFVTYPASFSTVINTSPPAVPVPGSLWWDSETGIPYIYYDDGNTSQWVAFTPNGAGASGVSTAEARKITSLRL